MATSTRISIHDYLSTSYRPDCDYVDGFIEQRNLGGRDHAKTRKAHRCNADGTHRITELRTEDPEIVGPLPELLRLAE